MHPPTTTSRRRHAIALLSLAALVPACGNDPEPDGEGTGAQENPPIGQTDFFSADGENGQRSEDGRAEEDAGGAPSDDGGDERTVEEGDIYRVLSDSRILNLNSYRGLQVIDFADPSEPAIVGRLAVAGYPVEMYVVGDDAFVLLNNWRGYYGARGDVDVSTQEGGLVLSIDISDATAPEITGMSFVPGWIQTSRLTRQGDTAALYVVANWWGEWTELDGSTSWDSRTVVKSFDVSSGAIVDRSQLDLGGYVAAVQATPEALLVARTDWSSSNYHSTVSLVDISDPEGTMVEGDEVEVSGIVENKFNMDLYEGVLRIVSGATWSGTRTNHVETFDASSFDALAPIDEATFGDGEQLFATLFVDNRAFFVTYLRTDPFHAFEIGDDGTITEKSEFIVSGWNDYFRPVLDDTRLIGIGVNDDAGRTMAVSLYDITDLENPDPLVSRAQVQAESSWSEAQWDDRAFSVIEDAVDVVAPDGTPESGLVLLPFSGWNSRDERYFSAVQIYTFSDETLTRRGLMDHGTQVRRSFLADDDMTANLSEAQVSFFDTSDPNEPSELGRVDLAPNFSQVLRYGDWAVRVHSTYDDYYGWWGADTDLPPSLVEIVPLDDQIDIARPVASFEIPSQARVHQLGDLLIAVQTRYLGGDYPDYDYETIVQVWDLADPSDPVAAGELVSDQIDPFWGYGYWGRGWAEDCFDCGGYWWGYGSSDDGIFPAGDALVFLQPIQQQELVGRAHTCYTYSNDGDACAGRTDSDTGEELPDDECVYHSGSISCTSVDGGAEVCTGEISACSWDSDGNWFCEPIDPDSVSTTENCYDWDQYRYWMQYELSVLDLSDPASPAFADEISLPVGDEGVSVKSDGDGVWVSYRRPWDVEDDPRSYVRYFIRRFDLSNPSAPVAGTEINVPGELLAVDGDTIFTRDSLWGESIVEAAVARLELFEGRAYLQAIHRFEDQQVYSILLDGEGHVLVSHRLAWSVVREPGTSYDELQHLSVLDGDSLEVLADVSVDSWAELKDAEAGRALFQVPGGLLVMNVSDASNPWAQAYFPILGWPWEILLDGGRILFAAGRYGIYSFDANTFNLLPPI